MQSRYPTEGLVEAVKSHGIIDQSKYMIGNDVEMAAEIQDRLSNNQPIPEFFSLSLDGRAYNEGFNRGWIENVGRTFFDVRVVHSSIQRDFDALSESLPPRFGTSHEVEILHFDFGYVWKDIKAPAHELWLVKTAQTFQRPFNKFKSTTTGPPKFTNSNKKL